MFFKFRKYNYIPSYEIKTSSKIEYLNKTYEYLFLKYIKDKDSLNNEEKEILYEGIKAISFYIIKGLFYQILENYNSKTPIEKKLEALYNVAKQQYNDNRNFEEYLEEELIIMAEDTIYESIGMIEGKLFKKETEKSNFISYLKKQLFFKFLNFLEKKINNFKNCVLDLEMLELSCLDKMEKEEFISDLIEDSNLSNCLSKDILEQIKENLINEHFEKEIIPYIEFLIEFKNKEKE
jgi:hypothetical protein